MSEPKLKIPILKWFSLLFSLKRRGQGKRESGAFLVGRKDKGKVSDFICYDDLDGRCLDNGIIEFDGKGYVSLWEYCEKNNLSVLADVHTHPGNWVGQSMSDRTNPMIAQQGHLAMIIPRYAKNLFQDLSDVGIYQYKGNHEWSNLSKQEGAIQLTIL